MNKSRMFGMVGLVGALAVSGYGHDVIAQTGRLLIGGHQSNFGQGTLAPGFPTDPTNVNVVSGGNIDASTLSLGSGCVGFLTRQPDYILHMRGNSPSLRIYVTIPGAAPNTPTDTTLVVNDPHSAWHCNDDSYGTANPTVDLPSAGAGQYDIWIGSYQAGQQARGQLHITELDSNHP